MRIYLYMMLLFTIGYLPLHRYAGAALRRQLGWLPYLAIAVIYLVGSVTPWPSLLLVACVLVPLVRPGTRVDVACRFVLLNPLIPDVTVTLVAGGHVLGQITPFGALALGSLLASGMAANRPALPRPHGFGAEQLVVLLLLLTFGVAAPRFGDTSALVRSVINAAILLVVPIAVLLRTVRAREELRLVIGCLGASAVLLAVPALYEHHAGWSLFDTMSARLSSGGYLARSSSIRGGALRASVTMRTAVELGLFFSLGLFALYLSRPLFRSRRAVLAAMGLVVLGMLAAQSRGAFVAMGAGVLVILVAQHRWMWAGAAAGLGALGYLMLRLASASSVRVAAFMGAGQNVGAYRDYRTLLLERGLQEGRKHPWLGASLDTVTDELADLTQGEHIVDFVNSYLNIYLLVGAIGLGLLAAALLMVGVGLLRRTGAALRRAEEMPRLFAIGTFVALLVSLVASSFYGRVPFMLMVVLAAARLVRVTDKAPRRAPPVPVLEELRREAERAPVPA